MEPQTFTKLPLGGVDRRSLVPLLAERGPVVAREQLAAQLGRMRTAGVEIAGDSAVLILGGSNGITRALALQLLFGERIPVVAVYYDSVKMQIGGHHVAAMQEAADARGVPAQFFNGDATRDKTIEEVIAHLRERYRAVHLINGIAAGATKRYERYGPTKVQDLDVAFDPVLQVPDFSRPENLRQYGLVEVGVATDAEIERTNKLMGTSSLLWVEPLAEAGLIAPGESVVAFCDYDFEADDPVYAMGPLAGAKILQRDSLRDIKARYGARTTRICYPAMCTTALGAIPGGTLMYALTGQILKERGEFRSIPQLAHGTMALWRQPPPGDDLRLDEDYAKARPEFHRRKDLLTPEGFREHFQLLWS